MVLGDTSDGNIGVVVLGGSSDDIGAAVIGEDTWSLSGPNSGS